MTLVYAIGPISVQKFPLFIKWVTYIYILGPSLLKKIPLFIEYALYIFNRSFLSQKIGPLSVP